MMLTSAQMALLKNAVDAFNDGRPYQVRGTGSRKTADVLAAAGMIYLSVRAPKRGELGTSKGSQMVIAIPTPAGRTVLKSKGEGNG